ncbi:dTDP-4-dehydrorhamnose reductase [Paraburkholderia tropica]|uniref:dTDP-4-dehydrorhamnose reductase n=1 Tax=Paraburkholderia TaxID=1822464 RepID=UPI00161BB418|nr:dTDP-4-dehydrorhamnose reductase [Paraburkholderia tropica]MBB3002680.1 dTDP-4-dehydrorhamnose reductase [Paraburkholderia tropica]MBB6321963.1 dTDP-4-dehydrorhamnose reductase [Paraburkholderia tropica]
MSSSIGVQNGRATPLILLTGRNGQVGHELMRSLQGLGRVVAPERVGLDLSDPDSIVQVMRDLRPQLVINAAAYTAVERAETERELAYRINAEAPHVMALEAKRAGAVLIHYSTDYVFDGTKTAPYVETDTARPLSVYGFSKLAGERAIANVGCRHLILRTSWVYGMRGKNFLRTMLRLAQERDTFDVVADQFGAPTWSATIAAQTAHIVAQSLAADDRGAWWDACSGLYHLTASGCASWHDFASTIAAIAGSTADVRPIDSGAWPTAAQRPANSALDCSKLWRTFGLRAPEWDAALRCCLDGVALPETLAAAT